MDENKEIIVYIDADLEDLIPEYIENREKDIINIRELLKDEDIKTIERIGHSMKGSGGGYGFERISEIGKGIENACRDLNKNEIINFNNQLELYLKSIKIVFEEL
jgi:HPt (histidine-containing phosphotransfer) domain-containing protein